MGLKTCTGSRIHWSYCTSAVVCYA